MVLQLTPSAPEQNRMTPPKRQNYRAARAFYLVILVLSFIAAWSIITDRRKGFEEDARNVLVRRFEPAILNSTKKGHVHDNKEVNAIQ